MGRYHCTVDLLFDWLGLVCFKIKTKIVSSHTVDSKPVKQEVNGTVILPPLVFPGLGLHCTLVPYRLSRRYPPLDKSMERTYLMDTSSTWNQCYKTFFFITDEVAK